MNKKLIWTRSKARLNLFSVNPAGNYNWLFLPGGPGLGSESLIELVNLLNLPGKSWLVDFPDDGSNVAIHGDKDFKNWQQALIEACQLFEKPYLFAHSSGGMFALATLQLENILGGLVLMDSAPNASWQSCFMEYLTHHSIPEVEMLGKQYEENPSNELLKQMTILSVPYFSILKNIPTMKKLLESLPYNYRSHDWAKKVFDPFYTAKWIPTMPTLIFAGDQDYLTPLRLFIESKEFHRDNILIREIKDAAHFPWMDNPEGVKEVIFEYLNRLI